VGAGVLVRGQVSHDEDGVKLLAGAVTSLEELDAGAQVRAPERRREGPGTVVIRLDLAAADQLRDLQQLVMAHPGESPVLLTLGEEVAIRAGPSFRVRAGPELRDALAKLLGPQALTWPETTGPRTETQPNGRPVA